MSAELATRICHEFFIEPRRLIWIEYDPEKSGWKGSQDKWYELVEFDLNKEKGVFSNPRRLPVTPEVVKTLREKDGAKHHG